MAYKISDDCISCGACAENCPTEAIYEADGKYEIDADKCIDCGSCGAPTCRALAEDIVRGTACKDDCVMLSRVRNVEKEDDA
mgnify:CR=1 FL=1